MIDTVLYGAAAGMAALSLVFLVVSIHAFRGRRWLGSLGSAGTGVLFLSLGALSATVGVSTQGYTTLHVLGDQLRVDAHILKWRPLANVLGVHTWYELDRLSGRYVDIGDERSRPRTLHSLKTDKPRDLFLLAKRYTLFALLVDTEYGSATYVEVLRPARFEIRVSTTGLLVRETRHE